MLLRLPTREGAKKRCGSTRTDETRRYERPRKVKRDRNPHGRCNFLEPFFFPVSSRSPFFYQLKSKVGNIPAKATALRISLNIDGAPIDS
eukprot:09216_6